MGMNEYTYFGLAVDTKGVDLEVEENLGQDLFCRISGEGAGVCKYWTPNRGDSRFEPQECGEEEEITSLHKELAPECKAFLDKYCPDHRIVYVYFSYWN